MGSTDKAVIARVNDDGILNNLLRFQFIANHAKSKINRVYLLVVGRHDLVVIFIVTPRFKTFKLSALLTLRRKMLTITPAIICRFSKFLSFINVIKTRVRSGRPMRCFKTNGKAKWFLLLNRLSDHLFAKSPV